MTSTYPVVDLELWLRFVAGVIVLLWLPGHLLLGRFLGRRPELVRIAMSLSMGMLLVAALARLMSLAGWDVRPWPVLGIAVALGAVAGKLPGYRQQVRLLDADEPSPRVDGALLLAAGLVTAMLVVGLHDFAAPPHVHDAANHAFMTLRVSETGSMRGEEVFGPPYGPAALPYLVGLHAIASLLAQATTVAPYVSTWFLGLLMVALMSWSLALVWREWRFPPATVGIAALFVAANQFVPTGILYWGGWGALAGMFLVPTLATIVVRFWATGSPWLGALGGLGAGSMLLVHGSELPVAGLIAGVGLLANRVRPRFRAGAWAIFIALMLAVGWDFFTAIIPSYLQNAMDTAPPPERLGKTVERALHAAGKWAPLQGLWVLGLILGVRSRRWRVSSITAVALVIISVSLGTWEDPVSKILSTPFYRQPARIRYVLMFFMAPLMATSAVWLAQKARFPRLSPRSRWMVSVLLLAALIVPAQPGVVRVLRNMADVVAFDAPRFEHARAIGEQIEPQAWVANGLDDGSAWAMHVSGRRFLVPTWWVLHDADGTPFPDLARDILADPWPARVLSLDPRPEYAYGSDQRFTDALVYDRARLDADPRFQPVLVGENATLYRILWP